MNNSAAVLSAVGEGENALLCNTNKEDCCGISPNQFGEFYYPNGIKVPIAKQQQGFYRNRGENVVRLNRRDGTTSPTGKYRCEIPDANGLMQDIYITLSAQGDCRISSCVLHIVAFLFATIINNIIAST